MKKIVVVLFLCISFLTISTVFTFSGQIVSDFEVHSVSEVFALSWHSENENSVKEYILEKSVDGINFVTAKRFAPKGNREKYSFSESYATDAQALVYYRIKIVSKNNVNTFSEILHCSPNTSLLSQTWNGIKIMFQ